MTVVMGGALSIDPQGRHRIAVRRAAAVALHGKRRAVDVDHRHSALADSGRGRVCGRRSAQPEPAQTSKQDSNRHRSGKHPSLRGHHARTVSAWFRLSFQQIEGDWRSAYANYLVQYTKFYAQEGIRITDLGFTNEPNWTATYSSMRLTPAQSAELARVVGPVATAAGLNMNCCDAVNWSSEASYSAAIVADSQANRYVTTHTGHSYGSAPTSPLSAGGHPTWMSEWSPDGSTWNENWDDGSGYDGFTVAQALHTALTAGNVNGYVYWYGVSTGATRAFIQANGTGFRTSKRLYAMANYSRFIRPGATRIGASSPDANLRLSAYRNSDGSIAVVVLNAATSAISVNYALQNASVDSGTATPYLTNSTSSTAAINSGMFTATGPARSLVTYAIRPGGGPSPSASASRSPSPSPSASPSRSASPSTSPAPSGACSATYQVTNQWAGGFQAEVTVRAGAAPINGWTVRWTFPNGQTITQLWNGDYTASGSAVTVRNLSYNGSLPAAGSTTFGLLGSSGSTNGVPVPITCTSP